MSEPGTLYVVATPIGNLQDLSPRAVQVLQEVDVIAAEDTRHAALLCQRFAINTPLRAYHDFSSPAEVEGWLGQLQGGKSVALISDAGTPLIADPGYRLVNRCRGQGVPVLPVPGASALVAALSVAGLPSDRFVFEGFLPARQGARVAAIECLQQETRTIVFYESPHRIEDAVADLVAVLGADRPLFLAREISKKFEAHCFGTAGTVQHWLASNPDNRRGEFVLVVAGVDEQTVAGQQQGRALAIAQKLHGKLSAKEAVSIACEITGARKNPVYAALLAATAQ